MLIVMIEMRSWNQLVAETMCIFFSQNSTIETGSLSNSSSRIIHEILPFFLIRKYFTLSCSIIPRISSLGELGPLTLGADCSVSSSVCCQFSSYSISSAFARGAVGRVLTLFLKGGAGFSPAGIGRLLFFCSSSSSFYSEFYFYSSYSYQSSAGFFLKPFSPLFPSSKLLLVGTDRCEIILGLTFAKVVLVKFSLYLLSISLQVVRFFQGSQVQSDSGQLSHLILYSALPLFMRLSRIFQTSYCSVILVLSGYDQKGNVLVLLQCSWVKFILISTIWELNAGKILRLVQCQMKNNSFSAFPALLRCLILSKEQWSWVYEKIRIQVTLFQKCKN